MKSVVLIAGGIALTIACWGMYGPVLHKGQELFAGNRLKPLICVGAAYFVVALLLPTGILIAQGQFSGNWSLPAVTWSSLAGVAGAIGAIGIILALSVGGKAVYVMPLVFGGAPVINTVLSMYWSKAWKHGIHPAFLLGLVLVIVGAAAVLIYAPRPVKVAAENPRVGPATAAQPAPATAESSH